MSQKPNFKANGIEGTKKATPRREECAVWEKETVKGEKYLSIKITLPDGKEMWVKAFKNKMKKPGENHKPEYIGFERRDQTND